MNKVLRFSLLSVLMMLCGTMWADEQVTFDFTGDDAYALFGFSGFSAGDSQAGDFTETKKLTVDGVTLAVSPSTTNTANRMWSGSLRVYGGTLTFSCPEGKVITAIEFNLNSGKWGSNTANTGTLEKGSWTGSASEVVISIGGNTQIKSIVVTLGEGGTDPDPGSGSDVDGVKSVTVAEFLAAEVSTDKWYQLKGKVKNLQDGDQYGNFDLEDSSGSVYVYGLLSEKGGKKGQFQALAAEKGIVNGCTLTIIGNRGYYEKENKDEVLNAYFVAIEGGATPDPGTDPDPQPTGKRQYKKATSVESGKPYLIVAESKAAKPVPAKDKYGWLYVVDVEDVNGIIEMDDATYDFVFTSADGGYTIMQSDGRYLYQKGTYNNFNVDAAPTEGQYWTVTANADGTFKILNTNVNKWMQYSIQHSSYGSYADEQGVMPTLYVLDEGGSTPVVEEKTATFDATKDLGNAEAGEGSVTKEGVTMSCTNGILGNGQQYRFYKNSTLTFSAPGGTITKIEFTDVKGNPVSGFGDPSTGSMEGTVWTGSASAVSFVAENKQVRATLITVTYMDGEPQGGSFGGSQLSKYPYAKPELIAQAKQLLEDGDEEQLAEVMKEVARSHALAEGVAEAEVITDQLSGEWTLEEFTDGEGIEGEGYYKAEGKDIVARVYQTVPLKAGRYMLTATGRGKKYNTIAETIEERLQVMAINNDNLGRYQSIARNDREGGVYGEGWDDASDYFTMTADGEAVLGAYFKPIAGVDSWAEVGNFRLVRLGDVTRYISQYEEFYNDRAEQLDVLVHRTLKQGEWNSIVLPMDLDKSTIEAQFGKDTKVAALDKAEDGIVEFKSLKEAAIEANVPVLLKPTAVKESNRYIFRNVPISTTVSTVVKVDGFDFVGYYNPSENPVVGGLGFDAIVKDGYYAALTTTAALVPTGEAMVEEVRIDGETFWVAAEPDPEAKMAIIGSAVPSTPTAIDAIESAQQAGAIYNVAGQRVQQMTKGLYIIGGKKVVIK